MKNRKVTYHNYDIVFKYATQVMKDRMLDFLGLKTAPIVTMLFSELSTRSIIVSNISRKLILILT